MRAMLLIISLQLCLTAIAHGDEKKPAGEVYQERLEFDPVKNEWVAIAPPIAGTQEGDLALARLYLARNEFKKARKAFKQWRAMYPQSPQWPEALLYAAEVEISAEDAKPKSGDLVQAYKWLQEITTGWPGTETSDRAMRKTLIVAEMLLFKGRKQKVWGGTLWLSGKEEAIQMLDRIIDDYARESPIAEQALRLKADYHFGAGEFEEAEKAYARLMRDFPRGRYAKISLLRAGQSAFAQFPGVYFDDADLLEADVYLADFSKKYPGDAENNNGPELLGRIRESRAEKDFRVAQYYERVHKINPAAFYYRAVDRNYPGTTWAVQAHQRLIDIGGLPADSQPASEQAAAAHPDD
jgi:outer membrane protein assembly factor BamD (BamD/ComL family)